MMKGPRVRRRADAIRRTIKQAREKKASVRMMVPNSK